MTCDVAAQRIRADDVFAGSVDLLSKSKYTEMSAIEFKRVDRAVVQSKTGLYLTAGTDLRWCATANHNWSDCADRAASSHLWYR